MSALSDLAIPLPAVRIHPGDQWIFADCPSTVADVHHHDDHAIVTTLDGWVLVMKPDDRADIIPSTIIEARDLRPGDQLWRPHRHAGGTITTVTSLTVGGPGVVDINGPELRLLASEPVRVQTPRPDTTSDRAAA